MTSSLLPRTEIARKRNTAPVASTSFYAKPWKLEENRTFRLGDEKRSDNYRAEEKKSIKYMMSQKMRYEEPLR